MIRLRTSQGAGDKPAPQIDDDMIPDLPTAYIRSSQELTKYRSIVRVRTLDVPVDPTIDIGQLKEVVIGYMGIYGTNEVTSNSISIDEGGIVSQSIETRQIGGLMP